MNVLNSYSALCSALSNAINKIYKIGTKPQGVRSYLSVPENQLFQLEILKHTHRPNSKIAKYHNPQEFIDEGLQYIDLCYQYR